MQRKTETMISIVYDVCEEKHYQILTETKLMRYYMNMMKRVDKTTGWEIIDWLRNLRKTTNLAEHMKMILKDQLDVLNVFARMCNEELEDKSKNIPIMLRGNVLDFYDE